VRVVTAMPAFIPVIAAMGFVIVIRMIAAAVIMMPVIMAAIAIVGNMVYPAFQFNIRVEAAEASAFSLGKIEFPAFNAKFGKFRTQLFRVNPKINQRAQCHIA
jgi:hypothetical protein